MKPNAMLTQEDRLAVEAEIASAEKHTSVEFVAAISTESGRYDRAESLVGFLCAICGLTFVNILFGAAPSGDWSATIGAPLAWQAISVGVGFLIGNVLASYWHGLRRFFVSSDEMTAETMRAARHVFFERRISSTKERGGILLYVSKFERRVVVLTDARVMQSAGQSFCDRLRDAALAFIREGKIREGLIAAIQLAEKELAADFPACPADTDELPNTLLIFHPRP
jgi:putative membrane protein